MHSQRVLVTARGCLVTGERAVHRPRRRIGVPCAAIGSDDDVWKRLPSLWISISDDLNSFDQSTPGSLPHPLALREDIVHESDILGNPRHRRVREEADVLVMTRDAEIGSTAPVLHHVQTPCIVHERIVPDLDITGALDNHAFLLVVGNEVVDGLHLVRELEHDPRTGVIDDVVIRKRRIVDGLIKPRPLSIVIHKALPRTNT